MSRYAKKEKINRVEHYCLNCPVENDCDDSDPNCHHPRNNHGSLVVVAPLRQNYCGFPDEPERVSLAGNQDVAWRPSQSVRHAEALGA